MHELALAEAIVAIVEQHAAGRRVTRVDVRLGQLRQAVPGALTFAFELVADGTVAEGAELVVEQVTARGDCGRCGQHSELPGFPLRCAACGSLEIEIVSGEELSVESFDVVDAQPVAEEAI